MTALKTTLATVPVETLEYISERLSGGGSLSPRDRRELAQLIEGYLPNVVVDVPPPSTEPTDSEEPPWEVNRDFDAPNYDAEPLDVPDITAAEPAKKKK